MTQTQPPRLTVYYDAACPLCRREIAFYQRRRGADLITWHAIEAGDETEDITPGLTRAQALGRFHVRLPDGRLVSGAAGFAALWRALPSFAWLGWFAGLPVIRTLAELSYRIFLRIRPRLTGRRTPPCP